MARPLRQKSLSGIYHVTIRGVNKQRIFEQPDDYEALYRILRYVRDTDSRRNPTDEPNFFLYAYCIMDNHIHLLIQPNEADLGRIISRITQTYAMYFNQTYERVGHLFQDRFKSEVVENADYFFTIVRYIHLNPVKACICSSPSQYDHSSYAELVGNDHQHTLCQNHPHNHQLCVFPELCTQQQMEQEDARMKEAMRLWELHPHEKKPKQKSMMLLAISRQDVVDFIETDSFENERPKETWLIQIFKEYTQENKNAICQYIREKLDWLTPEEKDQAVVSTLLEMTGTHSITEFQQLDKHLMRTALAYLRDAGISKSRLSRLTGIPIGVIRYAKVYYSLGD